MKNSKNKKRNQARQQSAMVLKGLLLWLLVVTQVIACSPNSSSEDAQDIHVLDANSAGMTLTSGETYTLTLTGLAAERYEILRTTTFTYEAKPTSTFVSDIWDIFFADHGPNAVLGCQGEEEGAVYMFTLSNPSLNTITNTISFTAELIDHTADALSETMELANVYLMIFPNHEHGTANAALSLRAITADDHTDIDPATLHMEQMENLDGIVNSYQSAAEDFDTAVNQMISDAQASGNADLIASAETVNTAKLTTDGLIVQAKQSLRDSVGGAANAIFNTLKDLAQQLAQ